MRENLPSLRQENTAIQTRAAYAERLDTGADFDSYDTINLKLYWRVVNKYRNLIAACTVGAAFLALIYAFTATPLFTAQSRIKIGSYEPILATGKIEDILQQTSRENNYLDTQVQEISSFSLADQVLRDSKIKSLVSSQKEQGFFAKLFGGKSNPEDQLIEDAQIPSTDNTPVMTTFNTEYQSSYDELKKYLNLVNVQPVRKTSLVNIQVTHRDPTMAAYVVNRHASEYIDWIRFKRIEQQSRGLTFLKAQAAELRDKVSDLERELADYAETHSIVALNKDENITVQKMSQLNKLLTDATSKKIQAENAYIEAEAALELNSAGVDDVSVQAIRSELGRLEAERQMLLTKFTESYPKIQQINSQIKNLEKTIQDQRTQIVAGLKSKSLAATEEEKTLQEELELQKSQAFELSKKQVNYNVLNRELTASRELLQNIISQIKETSIAVESNSTNVSLVDPAVIPDSPTFPRKKLILALGLFSGLGLGLLAAFLLNYLDSSVRTVEDLVDTIGIPALGMVPTFEETVIAKSSKLIGASTSESPAEQKKSDISEKEIELPSINLPEILPNFIKNPKAISSEAYRSIRTALLLSQAGEPPKVILVTSAQASEGKTTTSLNLAASFASTGRRVIVIDADLRRPKLCRQLGISSDNFGVVEVLAGQTELQEAIIRDVVGNVSILLSGTVPPNPAELLGSTNMAKMLDKLAEDYDHVIVDSPPILPVTDSVVLSRYVDGVVLIVRAGVTPKRVIQDALTKLNFVGAKVLGCILNDVDTTKHEYNYYNRYYHAYYDDDTQSSSHAA